MNINKSFIIKEIDNKTSDLILELRRPQNTILKPVTIQIKSPAFIYS